MAQVCVGNHLETQLCAKNLGFGSVDSIKRILARGFGVCGGVVQGRVFSGNHYWWCGFWVKVRMVVAGAVEAATLVTRVLQT